ncbi:hypothetical protein [Bosea sp. FBZP-16]|uniref:hypothetical protein n=1 Tax=Bosea sp. FBZP-16 TaxID=2065382 RepID=UPI000C30AB6C|nr:hypothetical protein [Bosea sp. FBZP-16]
MIRTRETGGIVPREQPDSRGLSGALQRASEASDNDAEAQAETARQRASEEEATQRTTRTILFDAMYRAKRVNGDTGFDHADLAQVDAIEAEANRLFRRRRERVGDAS